MCLRRSTCPSYGPQTEILDPPLCFVPPEYQKDRNSRTESIIKIHGVIFFLKSVYMLWLEILHSDVGVGKYRWDGVMRCCTWFEWRLAVWWALLGRILLSRYSLCAHLHSRVPAEVVRGSGQVSPRTLRHECHRRRRYLPLLHRPRNHRQQGPQRSVCHSQSLPCLSVSPRSLFSKILIGFVRMDTVNVSARFEVSS